MKSQFISAVLLSGLLASSASAAEYFVKYHYSAEAYQKPVSEVMVHTGILCQSWLDEGKEYWTQVNDLILQKHEDHFGGALYLQGSSAKYRDYCEQPVVQYWVNFADGSSLVSPVYPVICDDSIAVDFSQAQAGEVYLGERQRLMQELQMDEAGKGTHCARLGFMNIDPYK